MWKYSKIVFSALIICLLAMVHLQAQDAQKLLKQMDDLMNAPQDREAIVQIIVENKNGKEKVRVAEMKQKAEGYRLYRYTEPENQAGIATLSLPDGVMWMYMPAFGKPKKISLLSKSQMFTGTDFSYEDMEAKPYSDRYTPSFVSESPESVVLALVPLDEKSKYSKIEVALDKTNHYPIQMKYFDRGDRHFKTAEYTYRKGNPYWYAEKVIMTDHKKEHSTTIVMTDVQFDVGIPDAVFDVENLAPPQEEK
jgi:outer membrane lipoprotein-sorting protein